MKQNWSVYIRGILVVLAIGGVPHILAGQTSATPTGEKARIAEAYGKLPLRFEANQDTSGEGVKFLSRGSRYTMLLTPTETDLLLSKSPASATAMRIRLAGGNPRAQLTGLGELPGKTNYLIGSDSSKWRTGVPGYARVDAHSVYPGIDVEYYGKGQEMEEDFNVAPGSDPRRIALDIDGIQKVSIDPQGELVLANAAGNVYLRKPIVYQTIAGVRHEIPGRYQLRGAHRAGFEIGQYDTSQPLVIDPVLSYSTYMGGSAGDFSENAKGIAVDSGGNAYVAGYSASADFPGITAGAFQTTYGGGGAVIQGDAFVAKLNPAGTALIYCTYLGGSDGDFATGIAVDSAGNAYVTGATSSANFPGASSSTIQHTYGGGVQDGFVAKINAAGSALIYSTYLGGSSFDSGHGIALDSSGNAYITGNTGSANFPGASSSLIQSTRQGSNDDFVAKVNAAGTALVYSTYLGGTGQELPGGIAVDSSGNAYVTGTSYSSDFTGASSSTIQSTFGGGLGDAFVTKVNAAGTALVYSSYLGGSDYDAGYGIAVDSSGNAYVAGATGSLTFPGVGVGSLQPSRNGSSDAFAVKVNAAGTALIYSTYLGGSSDDGGFGVAIDAAGDAYITGTTFSTDFPSASSSSIQSVNGGGADAFVAKLNPTGTGVVYSTYLGGSDTDGGGGIDVDSSGSAYVMGFTFSANFTGASSSTIQPAYGGSGDVFVAKLGAGTTTVADLSVLVSSFNLPNGTANSLLSKLQNAQASQAAGRLTPACNQIGAFINQVKAESGKSVTAGQASQLIAAATAAGVALGCP